MAHVGEHASVVEVGLVGGGSRGCHAAPRDGVTCGGVDEGGEWENRGCVIRGVCGMSQVEAGPTETESMHVGGVGPGNDSDTAMTS